MRRGGAKDSREKWQNTEENKIRAMKHYELIAGDDAAGTFAVFDAHKDISTFDPHFVSERRS